MNSEYARKQRGSEARAAVFFTDGHALQAMRNRVQRMRDGPARGPEEKKKKKKERRGKERSHSLLPSIKEGRRATRPQKKECVEGTTARNEGGCAGETKGKGARERGKKDGGSAAY